MASPQKYAFLSCNMLSFKRPLLAIEPDLAVVLQSDKQTSPATKLGANQPRLLLEAGACIQSTANDSSIYRVSSSIF